MSFGNWNLGEVKIEVVHLHIAICISILHHNCTTTGACLQYLVNIGDSIYNTTAWILSPKLSVPFKCTTPVPKLSVPFKCTTCVPGANRMGEGEKRTII